MLYVKIQMNEDKILHNKAAYQKYLFIRDLISWSLALLIFVYMNTCTL